MQIQAAGLPWFEADDYESFKPVLPDRHWHGTFAEWEAAAQQNFERLQNQGVRAVKAKVRSADFVEWCRRTGSNIDTNALLYFANEAAYRDLVGGH
jgi:hypothetical protein